MKVINTIANIIWVIVGGLLTWLAWMLVGLLLCITIVGIPFGKQCFKFAKISFAPFGKKVALDFSSHPVANVIWLLLVGWEMFLGYIALALVYMITIIGIPVGIQVFKISCLAIAPFGAKVTSK
ncbi:MAG: YccF domain-containing protein [Eubacteriales bacterium]